MSEFVASNNDGIEVASPPAPGRLRHWNWVGRIGTFTLWQLAAQGIQLLTGFLLIRWMTVDAYAQYGMALAFQGMMGQLVDLGFAGAIVALVGRNVQNSRIVGKYVQSALQLRRALLCASIPLLAVAFFWVSSGHGWPLWTSVLLCVSVIGYLHSQGWVACYSAPLLMRQQMAAYYKPSIFLSCLKLSIIGLANVAGVLGAGIASVVNVLMNFALGWSYRRSLGHEFLSTPADRETRREILRFSKPLIPGIVFFAFQSQLQVLLISVFGKSESVAHVSALGRLGQVYLLLSSFVSIIIGPYIARVGREYLSLRFAALTGVFALVGASVVLGSALLPDVFLWLLGPQYAGLQSELFVATCASSMAFLTGVVFSMNVARCWVYGWSTSASIAATLLVQVAFIATADLSHTSTILLLGLITAGVQCLVHLSASVYGLRHAERDNQQHA